MEAVLPVAHQEEVVAGSVVPLPHHHPDHGSVAARAIAITTMDHHHLPRRGEVEGHGRILSGCKLLLFLKYLIILICYFPESSRLSYSHSSLALAASLLVVQQLMRRRREGLDSDSS